MYISLNWLKEFVECDLAPAELAEVLTAAGFEVESIDDRRTWADGVVVGKVLTRAQHPNADKLSVCTVDVGGDAPLQIVCGAANVAADLFVPVAMVGTYLPKIDLKIKPAKLRGEASTGMICSLAELGLAKDSAGIHIFATAADINPPTVGTDVRPLLGLDDVILDLTSTANRADALSMVGIAREVSALTSAKLRLPTVSTPNDDRSGNSLSLRVSDPDACSIYSAVEIQGVKIQPSPAWLQQRLTAAGVRPINNTVDITNYVLLEWGQPLHAFDRDRLAPVGESIAMGVRFAENGETLKTLDDKNRVLTPQNLVITANRQPVALAGVMGGSESEVTNETVNIVLEAAIFDSVAIRRSGRSQNGLRTEASTRYERGVNLAEVEVAAQRAIDLILSLAGGTIVGRVSDDRRPDWLASPRSVSLRQVQLNRILGEIETGNGESAPLPAAEIERSLTAIGCGVTRQSAGESSSEEELVWDVVVPPYRYRDLEREIDLIEEVARVCGYDRFVETFPLETQPGFLSFEEETLRSIRSAFRGTGLTELVHYSYALEKSNPDIEIEIVNPMFVEYDTLRAELISSLVRSFRYNLERGNTALCGFEIGKIFGRTEEGLVEADVIGGILGGDARFGKWVTGGKPQPMSWYEAKGIISRAFSALNLPIEYQSDRSNPRLHPGRTASLWLAGERLGVFGQLHPEYRQLEDLPDAVYVFQLDLGVIFDYIGAPERLITKFANYPNFPAADRDLAFFSPVDTSLTEIEKNIVKAGGSLLQKVEVFDEYRGEGVPEGKRSLALRLTYRADDRTLTDADIDPVQQKIRDVLVEKFSVSLRS
jgi:phenylalanyl-tRNA synthetase beta chain